MKTRVFALALPAFVLLFISCTVIEKNNTDKSSPASKKKNIVYSESTKKIRTSTTKNSPNEKPGNTSALISRANEINNYASQNGYSTKYCFLIDMSLASGRNRFFVYDLEKRSVAYSGLVAHGCCNERFISHPIFSNTSGSGCSSLGKYKIGASYRGEWGKSYRLYGLDKSNSNAYRRAVVIHGNAFVKDEEIYPRVLCNSFGCPMVSFRFLDKLSLIIEHSEKPILLWIYR
jgi:L,D-transpeptidase catalytic domain